MAATTPTGIVSSIEVPAQRTAQPTTLRELIERRRRDLTVQLGRARPISYAELAKRAGQTLSEAGTPADILSKTTLHDYATTPLCDRMPHITVMIAIARALDVDPELVVALCAGEFGIRLIPAPEGVQLIVLGDRSEQQVAHLRNAAHRYDPGRRP